ncbi:hypothetical protein [Fodinibius halophilus]|uniref:Uncharacterized protein n=1 Tax=Fodinibius halophilus TaxID=1736908 RepID=A0A6M1T4J7_9BACT|nr:hypothetical protein [Fodinibius halophilus]NGP87593.1 hypothetical protein [Fodinibius halophilus]
MQHIIQQITKQLIDRLPEHEQYYRLHELRSWQFPSFIIKRIKIELERNLAESMIIPKTDWANTGSDAVLDAWDQFVSAIRAEARLPASYAQTVIETAVADIIEMLVQPRKNIPSIVFGNKTELDFSAIQKGVEAVVVYPHLGRLIPRYMEKKELDTLTKKRCKKLVKKADEKLTAKYSPLSWAQMLEPLFKLLDGEIDTELLRLFFEDKGMPRIARKFDMMNGALTRAELIEVLSSPDLLNFEGYEEEQSNLFDGQSAAEPKQQKDTDESPTSDKEDDTETGEKEKQEGALTEEVSTDTAIADEDNDNLNAGFEPETEPVSRSDEEKGHEEDGENNSLNAVFSQLEEQGDTEEADRSAAVTEDLEQEQSASDEGTVDEEDETLEEPESSEEETAENTNGQQQADAAEEDDTEETPMWMRYMSDEEIAEHQKEQQEQDEETDEDGFIDEPIIDLTQEDASEKEIRNLQEQLSGDRERFIEDIFRGSERAYEEAVEEIAAYASWRDVSKYIEKDIFKRNLVDMYSESAVDFTDRLQNYFLEKQNRNK